MTASENRGGRLSSPDPEHIETHLNDFTTSSPERNTASTSGPRICIDDNVVVTVHELDLADSDALQQLTECLRAAQNIEIQNAESLYDFNRGNRERFLRLIPHHSPQPIQFVAPRGDEPQSSLFQALLTDNLPIVPTEHARVQSVVETLVSSAAVLGVHTIPQAAKQICEYLTSKRIQAPTVAAIKKQITQSRNDSNEGGDGENFTPPSGVQSRSANVARNEASPR